MTSVGFAGMVHPDMYPFVMPGEYVKWVHALDIPVSLREHAWEVLPARTLHVWHTIGEFRYADSPDYVTAVCFWDGREWLYGIEWDYVRNGC